MGAEEERVLEICVQAFNKLQRANKLAVDLDNLDLVRATHDAMEVAYMAVRTAKGQPLLGRYWWHRGTSSEGPGKEG